MTRHSAELAGVEGWQRDRLGSARRGENPAVIAKLRSGYLALGDTQFLPGYCVLLADADDVEHLTDLSRPLRECFLADMALAGEAMMAACAAWDPAFTRINYEILGNTWRHLHAHLFPRYSWEPADVRDGPVGCYPTESWTDPAHAPGPEHDRLTDAIARELSRVLAEVY